LKNKLYTQNAVKGITVVNKLEATRESSENKPIELRKLEQLHKFWPILRSTLEYEQPMETFEDGLSHKEVLRLCNLYKDYLSTIAQDTANQQKSLAGRMKDLEMFSAGILQQLQRRQEKIDKLLPHLQKVTEMSVQIDEARRLLGSCVPLMNKINSLLPEDEKLEQLVIRHLPLHDVNIDGNHDERDLHDMEPSKQIEENKEELEITESDNNDNVSDVPS
jgi:hypothetical protein